MQIVFIKRQAIKKDRFVRPVVISLELDLYLFDEMFVDVLLYIDSEKTKFHKLVRNYLFLLVLQ
jgi:hypothetical protein